MFPHGQVARLVGEGVGVVVFILWRLPALSFEESES